MLTKTYTRPSMPPPYHGPLPSMRALRTFESAGRRQSFSRAAEELYTTQSTVSRTIAALERELNVRLFERRHRQVTLTEAGSLFHEVVAASLARISDGASLVASLADENRIVIACSHGTSEMYLMPRYELLRQRLGEEVTIRVLACDYDMLYGMAASDADLVLSYDSGDGALEDRVVLFDEAVIPVCSPAYAERHAPTLRRPVPEWGSMVFLVFARSNFGWTTWEDWFDVVGRPSPSPEYVCYDNYVYLINAATGGHGLALGWRHCVGRYLDAGDLVTVVDDYVEFDRPHFAALTARGRGRALARRCLDILASMEACPSKRA